MCLWGLSEGDFPSPPLSDNLVWLEAAQNRELQPRSKAALHRRNAQALELGSRRHRKCPPSLTSPSLIKLLEQESSRHLPRGKKR